MMKPIITTTIKLFGIEVTPASLDEVVTAIDRAISSKRKLLLFAANLHTVRLVQTDGEFAKLYCQAHIKYLDGMPLVIAASIQRRRPATRVNGTALMLKLVATGRRKIFVIGSTEESLKRLIGHYPSAIVGSYAPPLADDLSTDLSHHLADLVRQSQADIVLMGLGPVKRERWLADCLDRSGAQVGIAIGSAVDILAGDIPRAPRLLRVAGLEWLWRCAFEPRRLGGRYLADGLFFLKLLISY